MSCEIRDLEKVTEQHSFQLFLVYVSPIHSRSNECREIENLLKILQEFFTFLDFFQPVASRVIYTYKNINAHTRARARASVCAFTDFFFNTCQYF